MGGHRFVGMCAQVRTPMRASEREARTCPLWAGRVLERKRKAGREGDEGSGPGGLRTV